MLAVSDKRLRNWSKIATGSEENRNPVVVCVMRGKGQHESTESLPESHSSPSDNWMFEQDVKGTAISKLLLFLAPKEECLPEPPR